MKPLSTSINDDIKRLDSKIDSKHQQSQLNLYRRLDHMNFKYVSSQSAFDSISTKNNDTLYLVQVDGETIDFYKGNVKISGKGLGIKATDYISKEVGGKRDFMRDRFETPDEETDISEIYSIGKQYPFMVYHGYLVSVYLSNGTSVHVTPQSIYPYIEIPIWRNVNGVEIKEMVRFDPYIKGSYIYRMYDNASNSANYYVNGGLVITRSINGEVVEKMHDDWDTGQEIGGALFDPQGTMTDSKFYSAIKLGISLCFKISGTKISGCDFFIKLGDNFGGSLFYSFQWGDGMFLQCKGDVSSSNVVSYENPPIFKFKNENEQIFSSISATSDLDSIKILESVDE